MFLMCYYKCVLTNKYQPPPTFKKKFLKKSLTIKKVVWYDRFNEGMRRKPKATMA